MVRAPEGFTNYGGWTFVADEPFHAMGYVTADQVFRDPCGSTRHSKYDTARDPGPTVADLAEALVAQKRALTSAPAPVTIDGHAGLYLEYRVSKGVDVAGCEDRAFDIFTTGPGGWYLEASRERARIWILNVDGDRVVLAWVAVPGVTRGQVNDLTDMVEDLVAGGTLVTTGLVDKQMVRTMIDDDRRGAADRSKEIWQLLTLEVWYRQQGRD